MICKNNSEDLTAKYLDHLHNGAIPSTYQFARENRQTETEAEKILWTLLRNQRLKGKKFRRQHTISNYILDFYCHECKLAIELDGNFHTDSEVRRYDKLRSEVLNEIGIRVVRFWNEEVINDPINVLQKISGHLEGKENK